MTDAKNAQLLRETLRDASTGVKTGQVVREVLSDPAGAIRASQVLREVFRAGTGSTQINVSQVVRESLLGHAIASSNDGYTSILW